MKKKPYKYLKFYHEWMETGIVRGRNGMCDNFKDDELFNLFIPDYESMREYSAYWGHDASESDFCNGTYEIRAEIQAGFVSNRQNIVLFMAAMNGEL